LRSKGLLQNKATVPSFKRRIRTIQMQQSGGLLLAAVWTAATPAFSPQRGENANRIPHPLQSAINYAIMKENL
jgi:hypothetical protein